MSFIGDIEYRKDKFDVVIVKYDTDNDKYIHYMDVGINVSNEVADWYLDNQNTAYGFGGSKYSKRVISKLMIEVPNFKYRVTYHKE